MNLGPPNGIESNVTYEYSRANYKTSFPIAILASKGKKVGLDHLRVRCPDCLRIHEEFRIFKSLKYILVR